MLCERLPIVGRLVHSKSSRFPVNVRYGNIVSGLPIVDNSCAGIYASHVLEHLSLGEMRGALVNTYRMLTSGGVFRCVVPDLNAIARKYVHSTSPTAAHELMRELGMARESSPKSLLEYAKLVFGRSLHLWMWDERSLMLELRSVGFHEVRRCEYGDATDSMFTLVEDRGRFANSVALEGRKL